MASGVWSIQGRSRGTWSTFPVLLCEGEALLLSAWLDESLKMDGSQPGLVVHTCVLSTHEAEAGGGGAQGHPQLQQSSRGQRGLHETLV